jgi:hypothetical protein
VRATPKLKLRGVNSMRSLARGIVVVAAIAALCLPPQSAPARPEEAAVLLEGVNEISLPCCIGPLVVTSQAALPVVLGAEHDLREPVVAVTTLGQGRAVAFGHPGYFGADALGAADGGRLILNALRWAAAHESEGEQADLRVGVRGAPDLPQFLREQGVTANNLQPRGWHHSLVDLDVVCLSLSGLSDVEVAAVRSYLRRGGGVLAAGKAGDWLDENPGEDLSQYPGNRLLAEGGIYWAEGNLGRPRDRTYLGSASEATLCHASVALEAMKEQVASPPEQSPEEAAQATHTLSRALTTLPDTDEGALPEIKSLLGGHQADFSDMKSNPVTAEQPLSRLLLVHQVGEMEKLSPDEIEAHPASSQFPGALPSGAPRVSRSCEIDCSVPGWHSTGLYAAPGEVIEAEVPLAAEDGALRLRIGAHSDATWHLPKWRRVPEITSSSALEAPLARAASAFGGLVYVEVPKGCQAGVVEITLRNAVQAPYYIRGETDPSQWKERIRHLPAPWAELQGDTVIITVPSSAVRDLDDAETVVQFWDGVLDADAELAALPPRERPERMVADEQISAGYMHAGYPIMTHLDAVELVLDPDRICGDQEGGGGWGFFHELGHNHQSGDWTFNGTGEVTCNLFSLYSYEMVCGVPVHETREQLTPEWQTEQTRKHLADGAEFEKWKASPFLGLVTYSQLIDGFGWDAFRQVFAEYRDLPDEERPKNDNEKRDQWLVRFSRTAGRDLGPFFEAWGIPTSQAARDCISDLPDWMPEGFPPE